MQAWTSIDRHTVAGLTRVTHKRFIYDPFETNTSPKTTYHAQIRPSHRKYDESLRAPQIYDMWATILMVWVTLGVSHKRASCEPP